MTLLAVILGASALASTPPPNGYDAVRAGDEAWSAGDRRSARDLWTDAAESPHPATAAMAEARLLQVSGGPGLLVHGPRLDRALARCPVTEAWCALAHHDAQFFMSRLGIGPPPPPLSSIDAAPTALDRERTRRTTWTDHTPQPVPTWTVGLAPFGSSGLGFGAALLVRHPDLGLRGGSLTVLAGSTLSDDRVVAASVDTPGIWGLHVEGSARHIDLEAPTPAGQSTWTSQSAVVGPRMRVGRTDAWLGPSGWRDRVSNATAHRLGARGQWNRRVGEAASVGVEAQWMHGASAFFASTVETRIRLHEAPWAMRGVWTTTVAGDSPPWRQPGWGGGEVLRHGRYLQYQAPWLAAWVAERRQPIKPWWTATTFAEVAWTGAPTGGVGVGSVFELPPRPSASLRLDLAVGAAMGDSRASFGASTGWGWAF